MILMETLPDLTHTLQEIRNSKKSIGLVPTMGFLHEGHGSLMKQAKEQCDYVVLSIFVNPLQFGPNEDFDRYPRDLEKDLRYAKELGVDLVFHPSVEKMYPAYPSLTKVTVGNITDVLCGASRPGHFDGVATVVSKLFHLVSPNKAFFGLKDAQQVAVIQQMVKDLNFPVEIVSCPIVREADGLAKSSRNVYLSEEERKQATILFKSLQMAELEIQNGENRPDVLVERIKDIIRTQPLANMDYVDILSFPELNKVSSIQAQPTIIALAARFGKTRLIDNMIINAGSGV